MVFPDTSGTGALGKAESDARITIFDAELAARYFAITMTFRNLIAACGIRAARIKIPA
jgi:hypothetical protein